MKGLLNSWRARFSEKWAVKDLPKTASRGSISKDQLSILPECRESYLVFVDGYLDLSLSCLPKELVALPLEGSISSYGLFLQNRWTKLIQEEKEEKMLLNGALAEGALFLYVPPHFVLSTPLQIHQVFTSNDLAVPRIEAILGKCASLSVVQTAQALCDCPWRAGAWVASLEEGASFNLMSQTNLGSKSRSSEAVRVQLKRDANFSFFEASRGGEEAVVSVFVDLAQENSFAHLKALGMLDKKRRFDCRFQARHIAPSCRSRQHVKMALFDEGRSHFEGKIYVEPEAQKTESYQLNQNLLLSNQAQAQSKPALEIFADDVKASHGAVVSQLGDEEMFYLASRGLSQEEGRKLLVKGFCRELLDEVPLERVRNQLLNEIDQWIK